jgi:putative endonuclease
MRGGTVYIVTNRPDGTLYLGVTNNLGRRVWEHRSQLADGFTKRYGLNKLVWYEHFADIRDAIQRERTMKHWSRAWKVRLILDINEEWRDLYEELNA